MANAMQNIGACVFDAYGTLFAVAAAAAHCQDDLGGKADALTQIWRTRQLEYSWLRSLMDEYVEFWQITGDALDYALAALGIDDPSLREKLMNIYMRLDAYPEVADVLNRLRAGGMKTAILSNGSLKMLDSAIDNAGISESLDAVFSVDSVGIYKPHPSVYQMAVDGLNISAVEICFMSSNAWDAAAAANFGFQVVWVNRLGQPHERIPGREEHEIKTLAELPSILGL